MFTCIERKILSIRRDSDIAPVYTDINMHTCHHSKQETTSVGSEARILKKDWKQHKWSWVLQD